MVLRSPPPALCLLPAERIALRLNPVTLLEPNPICPPPPWRPEQLRERLTACAALVSETRRFWDHRPFIARAAPWEDSERALALWLRGLSDAEVDALEAEGVRDGPLAPLQARVDDVTALPAPRAEPSKTPPWLNIKGRKRRQISWFRAALGVERGLPSSSLLVDWCGGKGHLSRVLGGDAPSPVLVVDHDRSLLSAAERLAPPTTSLSVRCADVTSASIELPEGAGLVALHACGCLSDQALKTADRGQARWLAVVPCCHHKAPLGGWRPMSATARQLGVDLSANGLRLTIADEVTASERVRARRRHNMVWRVGADLLLKARSGVDQWQRLEELPKSAYHLPYAAYCAAALAAKGLKPPPAWRPDLHLRQAKEAVRVGRALSLPRGVVRPALELLCVLDRALWLQERGWSVSVSRFCPSEVTPRNLLIYATR